jgi:hypothetical protein
MLHETPSLKILHLQPFVDDDHNASPLFQRLADSSSTLSDNSAKFLPRLENMFYRGVLNLPWDLIPKIFGPPWRPLSNLRLHCYGLFDEGLGDACIDETTLLQIWELDRQGISIEIKDAALNVDFLKFSGDGCPRRVAWIYRIILMNKYLTTTT